MAHSQPIHTVYGGAQLFKAGTSGKIAALARQSFEAHAPSAAAFSSLFEVPLELAERVYPRVKAKLEGACVEDFRIDFEDGFGIRPDAEEDAAAEKAAQAVAQGLAEDSLPPRLGIRIKALTPESGKRALRTLELFLSTLARAGGQLPPHFVVTLPKVTQTAQVERLVEALAQAEKTHRFPAGSLRLELMVETPEAIATDGRCPLPDWVRSASGRCVAAHFGAYDYTALLEIAAPEQNLLHPACNYARQVMQVNLAPTGVWVVDGATNVLPLEAAGVPDAWRLHFRHVEHALRQGIYQGWDLHPAQLPARYAAVYSFFLRALPAQTARLKNFVEQAARATAVGNVFDDAASGQGLLNFFLRGLSCGALRESEVTATGLTPAEVAMRSFRAILEGRRG